MGTDKQLSAKLLGPLGRAGFSADKQLMFHRAVMLLVTFVIYTVYHMSRRPMSIVRTAFHPENCTTYWDDNGIDHTNKTDNSCCWVPFEQKNYKELFSALDASFLFTYAAFMFVAGYVAERSNIRYFISASLILIGLTLIASGMAKTMNIHVLYYFIILQVVSGALQTAGWPGVVAVVGNWFGSSKKGTIFGIWNWHTSVGNIVGAAVAGAYVDTDWSLSFIVPGIICIGTAVFVFLFLIPKPHYVGLEVEISDSNEKVDDINKNNIHKSGSSSTSSSSSDDNSNNSDIESIKNSRDPIHKRIVDSEEDDEQAISFWKALMIPGVIEFSACLFFAKLVSYTFLYWLPNFLTKIANKTASEAAFMSILFDIGGCVGSLLAGLMADRTGSSALTCILFLAFAIGSLGAYKQWSNTSEWTNRILLMVAGLFINGPYALITTAVSTNLACKVPSKSAMATVGAIIDGTGSIGAAIGPSIAGNIDWTDLIYMTMGANFIAILSLIRAGYQEYCEIRKKW